jgi:prepilin-type N-terminal cleavage/methylation domain-containing protein
MRQPRFLNDQKGFTMTELLVVLAMLAIIMAAVYGVFASVNRTCTNNEVTAEVMQTVRTSLEFLEQDIRMAGLDRFDSADAGIKEATAIKLRFTADRNMDGVINTADLSDGIQEADLERITYAYDAASKSLIQCLSEGSVDDWQTMARNVDAFEFAYFDANLDPLALPIADLSEIRTVQIILTVEHPAGLADPVSRTIDKRILCRNLDF